jgi:hypothetical protein
MGEKKSAYKVLTGKSEGRIPFWSSGRRWGKVMKTSFIEMGWEVVYWELMTDICKYGNKPSGSLTCLECLQSLSNY